MSTDTAITDRAALALIARNKAEAAWAAATPNQRAGIRFGMFDVGLIRAAGINDMSRDKGEREIARQFTLALMDCASKDGGMRA